MFSKNQNNQNSADVNSNKIPVHTMQDDIESLNHPGTKEKFIEIEKNDSVKKNDETTSAISNPKAASSPFMNGGANISVNKAADFPKKTETQFSNPAIRVNSMPPNLPVKPNLPSGEQKNQKVKDEKEVFLKELAQKREMEREERQKTTISQNEIKEPSNLGRKVAIFSAVLVVIGLILGGYYYWVTQMGSQTGDNMAIENDIQESKEIVEVQNEQHETIQAKFSVSNPNVLPIDTENADFSVIKQVLINTAADVKAEGIDVPLDFVATDKSNSPISFVDFTLAMEIKLPAEILSYAEKDFSLYFYNDNGNVRLGLMAKFSDPEKVAALIRKDEANLYKNFASLFIEDIEAKQGKLVFGDGNYDGNAIRYANINESMTASIDYAIVGNQFILGTSKQTIRSILDKVKNSSQN